MRFIFSENEAIYQKNKANGKIPISNYTAKPSSEITNKPYSSKSSSSSSKKVYNNCKKCGEELEGVAKIWGICGVCDTL